MATLADIMTKVRRLVRAPSTAQLSDADLTQYINDFLLYDFPENLRLFALRTTLSFYTTPYVDVYDTNTTNIDDPLWDFKNAYITVHDPLYIGGKRMRFSQSRAEFYNLFPQVMGKTQIGTGDGITGNYTGTLTSVPLLQNNVLFTTYDANYRAVNLKDIPQTDVVTGWPTMIGDMVLPDEVVTQGTINYVTGAFDVTFPYIPAANAKIWAQYVQYTPAMPTCCLYYDNKFVLRPVPDIGYKVQLETYKRPDQLVNAADEPILEQHFSYISLGAAKRILEDRRDMEGLSEIMPLFKEQELLCQRRTIVQQADQRVTTIYSGAYPLGYDWDWNSYL